MQVTRAVASPESTLPVQFAAAFQTLLPPSLATPLAIALSGGADSLALTLLARDWARTHGIAIVALTVDHRLRDGSTKEAHHVASLMREHRIAHHILTPEHQPAGNNLMQAARQWRYDALADFCLEHSINHCVLGHHADDQLETVALAHLRGKSTLDLSHERSEGEAGMRAMRTHRGIHFLRPLLHCRKDELIGYLTARNVVWIEDPTNADPRFARARVRQQLVDDQALEGEVRATLAIRTAARDARDAALAEAMPRCIRAKYTTTCLDIAAWKSLAPELRSLLLANLIRSVGGKAHRPRRHETLRLVHALLDESRGKRTLGHCVIAWKAGTATIGAEPRV